jgi:hypothetical protein
MTQTLKIGALGLVAFLATGCLIKDTTETWYVTAAGDVTWVVLEKDVRSDAKTAADRQKEESEYWLAVQQQRHPIAAGLQEMGGAKMRTTVLRAEAPYTVQTEARFTGLDELGRRLLASVGVIGTSIVTRDGLAWEWTLVARDPSSLMSTTEPSDEVESVLADADTLRVVLTAGRFVSAEGFSISSDQRVATFELKKEPPSDQPEEPVVRLRLAWRNDR